jgi:hypothetical protein
VENEQPAQEHIEAPKKKRQAAAEPAPEFTPDELATKHAQKRPAMIGDPPYSADHLVADVLNGWTRFERTVGTAPKLTEAAYLEALEAAKQGKACDAANKRG